MFIFKRSFWTVLRGLGLVLGFDSVETFMVSFKRSFRAAAFQSNWARTEDWPKVVDVPNFFRSCKAPPPPPWCRRRSPDCSGCTEPESGERIGSRTFSGMERSGDRTSKILLMTDRDRIRNFRWERKVGKWGFLCYQMLLLSMLLLLLLVLLLFDSARDRRWDRCRVRDRIENAVLKVKIIKTKLLYGDNSTNGLSLF